MKESSFTIRSYHWFCETCQCEVDGRNVTYDETHDNCGNDVTMVLDDLTNPHPRQITTTDEFGNVNGCYDNPAWAKWERENGR